MQFTARRTGLMLAALALLAAGAWGYFNFQQSRTRPPVGATLVRAPVQSERPETTLDWGEWPWT